jgi:hypothetical protein
MVVPRSANELAKDSEFTLFAVTTFKKHSNEFIHKCREKRWTPREYQYKEGNKEEEAKEAEQLAKDEKKLWGEALRLGRTGYSESAMIWIHVLALRVFVETVLRYGLPLDFVCGIVQVSSTYRGIHRPFTDFLRPTQSQRRRPSQTSTRLTHTLVATLSAAIAKVGSRRTISPCRLIWHKPDRWASRNTRRTCTMSSRCYSHVVEALVSQHVMRYGTSLYDTCSR